MKRILILTAILLLAVSGIFAQTSEFTYQGRLINNNLPANGNYDFEFTLYDADTDGTALGTIALNNVSVSNGTFSVQLDFGNNFPGNNRYLEIKVKQSSDSSFTTLNPRQKITSTPYAYRSQTSALADNAVQLNGIQSNEIVLTDDPRMTDARMPVAGSSNYVQNTTTQQAATNFNIGGNGTLGGSLTANIVAASTQFNLGGSRFIGINGTDNTFVGTNTGLNIDLANGTRNSFFGNAAGAANTFGTQNSFFGNIAGTANTLGSFNSFFGRRAGASNTTGGNNTFVGLIAGLNNTTGNNNTAIGAGANFLFSNQSFSTAIGAGAIAESNNTIVLGRNTGEDTVKIPGNLVVNGTFDVPGGSGNYIQNTTLTQPSSNFNISGDGVINGNGIILGNLTVGGTFSANLPSGSGNYIQNTTTQQSTSNFNISGNGTVGGTLSGETVNATTQFNLGGSRVVSISGLENVFVGIGTGANNTTGKFNSFFGENAGLSNTEGISNSFFGAGAGRSNTTGNLNAFFGDLAGNNSSTGHGNSFFGTWAGRENIAGDDNSFFGREAGRNINDGFSNSFFGVKTGLTNVSGNNITLIGANADVGGTFLSYATAIGAGAVVEENNTISIGRVNGADKVEIPGALRVGILGSAGSTSLCQNAAKYISTCSSSIRYKSNIKDFRFGLNLIKRLRPVSFNWKADNSLDMGLVAEEVAEAEPLLVNRNNNGEVEGVKYDRVGVVLVNAVQEQQQQIESQQKQIDEQKETIKRQQKQLEKQKAELDALKALVCSQNPSAQLCQEKN